MNKQQVETFIVQHKLIDRIYEMMIYFKLLKDVSYQDQFKKFISERVYEIEYLESVAQFLEDKMKYKKYNSEFLCNAKELIYDINYLKQYLLDE